MAHARLRSLTCFALALTASLMFVNPAQAVQTDWDPYMGKSIQWFHTDEAKRIAQNILLYQRDNDGWPQYDPLRKDYSRHITYNDDAMGDTLYLLRDIAQSDTPFGFVPRAQRQACRTAFKKGIGCILATQVKMNGHLTGWCAQHDEKTLKPAKARSYELPLLSGQETVPIVELLMTLKDPPPAVVRSVQEAVAWFDRVKIQGIDTKKITNDRGKPDVVVVKNDEANPIWARFYELDTNRPMFSDRDGVRKCRLSEIERERRAGDSWYTRRPLRLLKKDYPKWQQEHAPDHNVLADD